MLLGEMLKTGSLPETAGSARLVFVSPDTMIGQYAALLQEQDPNQTQTSVGLSLRIGDTIILRLPEDSAYYPLMNGQQFVCGHPRDIWEDRGILFGGQDENPFLVGLNPYALKVLQDQGEEAFYKALIPQRIVQLANQWNTQPKRQGDIWALPIRRSQEELDDLFKWVEDLGIRDCTECQGKLPVFDTRHVLTGCWRQFNNSQYDSDGYLMVYDVVVIAQGVIQAPDHSPLILEEPHILGQTALLAGDDANLID